MYDCGGFFLLVRACACVWFLLFCLPAYLLFWVFIWMEPRTVQVIVPTKWSTAILLPRLQQTRFVTKKDVTGNLSC